MFHHERCVIGVFVKKYILNDWLERMLSGDDMIVAIDDCKFDKRKYKMG